MGMCGSCSRGWWSDSLWHLACEHHGSALVSIHARILLRLLRAPEGSVAYTGVYITRHVAMDMERMNARKRRRGKARRRRRWRWRKSFVWLRWRLLKNSADPWDAFVSHYDNLKHSTLVIGTLRIGLVLICITAILALILHIGSAIGLRLILD